MSKKKKEFSNGVYTPPRISLVGEDIQTEVTVTPEIGYVPILIDRSEKSVDVIGRGLYQSDNDCELYINLVESEMMFQVDSHIQDVQDSLNYVVEWIWSSQDSRDLIDPKDPEGSRENRIQHLLQELRKGSTPPDYYGMDGSGLGIRRDYRMELDHG